MDVRSLIIFVDTVRSGSFTSVAKKRKMSVSSISRTISTIEKELGIRLFQRTTRGLALTDPGSVYYEQIYGALDDIDRATGMAQEESGLCQGKIRVTASPSFGVTFLAPKIATFSALYPDLTVELILTDKVLNMVENHIDLAIRQGPLTDSNLIATIFLRTYYRVCASEKYLKANGKPSTPEELTKHRCIVFPLAGFESCWKFKKRQNGTRQCAKTSNEVHVQINSALKINNGVAIKQCAIDGGGIVMLSNWLIEDELKSGALIDVFPDYAVTATDYEEKINFVYPTREYVPAKVKSFISFLTQK